MNKGFLGEDDCVKNERQVMVERWVGEIALTVSHCAPRMTAGGVVPDVEDNRQGEELLQEWGLAGAT